MLGAHQVHAERRELLAPSVAPSTDKLQISTTPRRLGTGEGDRLGAHQVHAQRRELLTSAVAPSRNNGRARRQARARQEKASAEEGVCRAGPDYTMGSRLV